MRKVFDGPFGRPFDFGNRLREGDAGGRGGPAAGGAADRFEIGASGAELGDRGPGPDFDPGARATAAREGMAERMRRRREEKTDEEEAADGTSAARPDRSSDKKGDGGGPPPGKGWRKDDGGTADEDTTGGDTADGDTTDGDTTDDDSADGETTGGDTTDDDSADGDTTDGDTTDDDTADGDRTDDDTADGDTTDGDTADGDTTGGDTADGDTADGDTTDDDAADGDTTDDDAADDDAADPADGFDIDFAFSGFDGEYAGLMDAFTNAAAILEGIILGDLPDMSFWSGETIDDVLISASLVDIDGGYGVLGRAGPTAIRPDIKLPSKGMMEFDTADALRLDTEGKWEAVIVHEMLHVLGMGTLWGDGLLDLTTGEGTSDARFTGVNGNAAYVAGVQDGSIPSNDAGYLNGIPLTSDGAHWRENALDREIMTPLLDPNPTLEAITIAALEDMGYDTVWDDVTRDDDLTGALPSDDLLFA